MPIIRDKKHKNFSQIANELSTNTNLSYAARGIMLYVLSFPDDWEFNGEDFFVTQLDKKSKVRAILQELLTTKYLIRKMTRDIKGKVIGASYTFYETPFCENPNLENPICENLNLENQKMDESIENKQVNPNCENLNLEKPNLDYPNLENRKLNNTNILNNIYSQSEEDKYAEIFNHWNAEGVTKTLKLTSDIKKGIDAALKLKKEDGSNMTMEDIKQSISNYAELYKLQAFTYQWRLIEFLKRKQRDTGTPQLLLFLDNGTTYINYKARLNQGTNRNIADERTKEAYAQSEYLKGGIEFDYGDS